MGKWICHINKRRTINIVSLPSAHTRNIFKVTFIHFIQAHLLHQYCCKNNRNINVNSPLKRPRLVSMQVYGCRKYIFVWNQIFRLVFFQQETLHLLFLFSRWRKISSFVNLSEVIVVVVTTLCSFYNRKVGIFDNSKGAKSRF